jgi:hypothetical protein
MNIHVVRSHTLLFWVTAIFCTPVYALGLTIVTTQSLSLGSFAAGTGGTVVLGATGTRTSTGGVTLLSSNSGTAAQFLVTGAPIAFSYGVTLPTSTNLTGPGTAMVLNQFTVNPTSGYNTGLGGQTIAVGGTLSVANNQTAGSYSGSFTVTVHFP